MEHCGQSSRQRREPLTEAHQPQSLKKFFVRAVAPRHQEVVANGRCEQMGVLGEITNAAVQFTVAELSGGDTVDTQAPAPRG